MLDNFTSLQANGKQEVVHNGHLPGRYLQTWLGDITQMTYMYWNAHELPVLVLSKILLKASTFVW
ncbi:hypothetical protein [Candidatus Enterovibrio escicola]|uniref:hypothetical protein n=1 Tax=Candidatus Enterovibrio escicola TaxID=1927127 RepID=UPI00167FFF61|nr:hypothetical protein [Candidatus Enterovibrio escacola]